MGRGYCFGCMEQIDSYPCPYCGQTGTIANPPFALRSGTILKGRYLVGKVLGQGGFGITYMGLDLQLQRRLAIKEYYPSSYAFRQAPSGTVFWNTNPAAEEARMSGRDMFLKEARKMSKVSHIGEVVRVFDLFQENDTAYICMEFIDGVTLASRLKANGPLSWEQAKQIFLPAIAVLEQVHKAGLVHRDISPDNIMIRQDGSIRILDLGAAKDLKVNSGLSSMQVAKSGFSPPEQYMQRGNSGSWTDVYAMAATMYYTLTGKLPLPAMDRMNPEGDTLDWTLPELQALPKMALKALKHAMALRISDRTQTMDEFSRGLAARPGQKPSPTPGTKTEPKPTPLSTPKPKPKPIGALIVVAAVLLIAGILVTNPFSGRSDDKKTPAETTSAQLDVRPVSAAAGSNHTVILMSDGTVRAFGRNDEGECDVSQWSDIAAVSAEENATFGIKHDGTVIFTGKIGSPNQQSDIAKWSDIVSIASGLSHTVALKSDGTVVAVGKNTYGQCNISEWTDIVAIDAGYLHTVGLKSDGTVVAAGWNYSGQCTVYGLHDIVDISAGHNHTVFLKADGTVVARGDNWYEQCNITKWQNIVGITAGNGYTVGVTGNGDVLTAGNKNEWQYDISRWENVVSVTAGHLHTIGLTADGKVLAAGNNEYGQCDINLSDVENTSTDASVETVPEPQEEVKPLSAAVGQYHTVILMSDGTVKAFGDNTEGKCEVSQWADIAAITAEPDHTIGLRRDGRVEFTAAFRRSIGTTNWFNIVAIDSSLRHSVALKADGTLVAVGANPDGQCNISDWKDIVGIAVGSNHTVGLRSDGTVVAVGWNNAGQCSVNGWRNIIAISAAGDYTVGLKADGTVVAVGDSWYDQSDISKWKNIVGISAGYGYTVGVTSSGEVLAAGNNNQGQCDVSGWENVISVSAGSLHTVGITADGKVLATGNNEYGQCDIDLSQ